MSVFGISRNFSLLFPPDSGSAPHPSPYPMKTLFQSWDLPCQLCLQKIWGELETQLVTFRAPLKGCTGARISGQKDRNNQWALGSLNGQWMALLRQVSHFHQCRRLSYQQREFGEFYWGIFVCVCELQCCLWNQEPPLDTEICARRIIFFSSHSKGRSWEALSFQLCDWIRPPLLY